MYSVSTMQGGAGFLASTVSSMLMIFFWVGFVVSNLNNRSLINGDFDLER